jgi:hypothetical protein
MLTSPRRRFRLRLKTSVTAVLLISVFISSSFLVQSAHAQGISSTASSTSSQVTGNVSLLPNVGSCNPFANTLPNSELFLVASGYDDLSSSSSSEILASDYEASGSTLEGPGQLVREAAVYANGNEPMATAIASASVTAYGGPVYGDAQAVLQNWPYLIFNKATGMPFANYQQSIPVDLQYSFSMNPTGSYAYAYGEIYFGDAKATEGIGTIAQTSFQEGTGDYAFMSSSGSPEGTLSVTYFLNGGPLTLSITAQAEVNAQITPPNSPEGNIYWPLSEAQAVVDPYVYIDPSSPLAGQLQVYVGKTANANPSDPSEWTPSVQTSIDLDNIVPLATPFANSTESPSSSSTPTVSTSPIVPEFSSQLLIITLIVSMLIVSSAVIIAKKKITCKTQRDQHS